MKKLKITLFNGDITGVHCSVLFMKHIEGFICMPEQAISEKLSSAKKNIFKEKEKEEFVVLSTNNQLPYPFIHVVNFHYKDLPFSYSSVDAYARAMIDFAFRNNTQQSSITSIATAVHGPGAGLDASEAMERMLIAMADEVQKTDSGGELEEIIFVEKDESVFERLQERIAFLVDKKILVVDGGATYLASYSARSMPKAEQQGHIQLKEKHVFVAMPFDKSFDDVYFYGIKEAVECNGRVSERTDQAFFTEDIIVRIKKRIVDSEFIIADISGNNPNVLYEIGLADGVSLVNLKEDNRKKRKKETEKKIILITQEDKIPFDIQTRNTIRYDRFNIHDLEEKLAAAINNILQEAR